MLKDSHAFSGFAIKDLDKAEEFYGKTLGLNVSRDKMGLELKLAGGNSVFVYDKADHEPATYTILNFPVTDINKVVADLKSKDVKFMSYDMGGGAKTDKDDIMRGLSVGMGPDIAWFTDPSGNVLSVLQDK